MYSEHLVVQPVASVVQIFIIGISGCPTVGVKTRIVDFDWIILLQKPQEEMAEMTVARGRGAAE